MRLGAIEGIHHRRRGKYGRRNTATATAPDLVQLSVADISYLRI